MENQTQHDEIGSLIKAIHEDRQAAKDKERRDSWTKYVSLMIVFLAVITAYGSLKSGGYGSKVLLSQAKASDEWAFFQAKSIKRALAEMESRLARPSRRPMPRSARTDTSKSRMRFRRRPRPTKWTATTPPSTGRRLEPASPLCKSPSRWRPFA